MFVLKDGGESEKPSSPAKSDTLRSTDSASGGDTLEERSSKEVGFTVNICVDVETNQ